jgi:hypothetical protein
MNISLKAVRGFALTLGATVYGCYLGPSVDTVASNGASATTSDTSGGSGNAGPPGAGSSLGDGLPPGSSSTASDGASLSTSSSGTSSVFGGGSSSGTSSALGTASSSSSAMGSSSSSGAGSSSSSSSSVTSSSSSSVVCPPPPADAGVDFSAPAKCSSGKMYTGGFGPTMEPGLSCYNCHGTQFTIVGTVYPTAHEPDACNGANVKGATVTLTDASNTKITLTPNTVGNFYSDQAVALPFTAVVSYSGKTIAMTTPQMNTDCNSCHSQQGDSCAPGRIVLP